MAAVTERSRFGEIIWPVLAWIVALIFFFPIFWLVFTSFKTDADAVKPEHLFFFTPTLENYANEIPKEIIEASKMDGVTTWGEIKDILIPLAWGGVASTALLTFIFCWNEAYWTVRLTTIDAATLSKLIEGNRAPEGLFFGRLSAVSTAAVGPIVVLGWFCQKQLVQGLTFGAVK